jgi:hypothetical protein
VGVLSVLAKVKNGPYKDRLCYWVNVILFSCDQFVGSVCGVGSVWTAADPGGDGSGEERTDLSFSHLFQVILLSMIFQLFRKQGCGSGSGLDPDSETLWIRIRIGNPDPGARKLRNFSGKNALFSYF